MIRPLTAAVALVIAAGFGLAVRQATSTDAARERLLGPNPTAGTAALLRHAATLNPDRSVDLLKARLAFEEGDVDAGRRLVLDVVHDEPANVEAWTILAVSFVKLDPALAARARDALRRLAPDVPDPA